MPKDLFFHPLRFRNSGDYIFYHRTIISPSACHQVILFPYFTSILPIYEKLKEQKTGGISQPFRSKKYRRFIFLVNEDEYHQY